MLVPNIPFRVITTNCYEIKSMYLISTRFVMQAECWICMAAVVNK